MASAALTLAAQHTPDHPALRWTPRWQPAVRAQHRRIDATTTACGLTGTVLVLAETDDPRCERGCWGPVAGDA